MRTSQQVVQARTTTGASVAPHNPDLLAAAMHGAAALQCWLSGAAALVQTEQMPWPAACRRRVQHSFCPHTAFLVCAAAAAAASICCAVVAGGVVQQQQHRAWCCWVAAAACRLASAAEALGGLYGRMISVVVGGRDGA